MIKQLKILHITVQYLRSKNANYANVLVACSFKKPENLLLHCKFSFDTEQKNSNSERNFLYKTALYCTFWLWECHHRETFEKVVEHFFNF